MTTNIDRAAKVLWLPEPHLSDRECDDQARELAQALAAEGLLMPDLPEAKTADDGTPYWDVFQPGSDPGTVGWADDYGEYVEEPAADIEYRALAMLAAVRYVKENK